MAARDDSKPDDRSSDPPPQVSATGGGVVAGSVERSNLHTGTGDQFIQNGTLNVGKVIFQLNQTSGAVEVLTAHLQKILRQCDVVWCPGLEDQGPGKLKLLNVHADLHTWESGPDDSQADETAGVLPKTKTNRVPAVRSVVEHQRLAILGEPGGGKSTFLRYLAVSLADQGLHPENKSGQHLVERGWPLSWLSCVPIWIELRLLPKATPKPPDGSTEVQAPPGEWLWNEILECIAAATKLEAALVRRVFEQLVAAGRLVFLFDGLDEVTEHIQKEHIQNAIWQLATDQQTQTDHSPQNLQNRFLVTCRKRTWDSGWSIPGWEPKNGAEVRVLDWFDLKDRTQFVTHWFKEQARALIDLKAKGVAGEKNKRRAKELESLAPTLLDELGEARLNRNQRLQTLISLPLNLTMVAWLRSLDDGTNGKRFDSRAILFEQVIHAILWDLDAKKGLAKSEDQTLVGLVSEDRRRGFEAMLARIIFEALKEDPDVVTPRVTRGKLDAELMAFCGRGFREAPSHWAHKVLETFQCRIGLLKVSGDGATYELAHRSFAEFLAGVHLARCRDFSGEAIAWLSRASARQPSAAKPEIALEEAAESRERLWEPLRLACGYLSADTRSLGNRYFAGDQRFPGAIDGLLRHLIREGPTESWRDVWLAGELLLELGNSDSSSTTIPGGLADTVSRRLLSLVEDGHLSAAERAAAGRCLGWLGDPRRGVVPRNLPDAPQRLDLGDMAELEFCYVPADPPRKGKKSSKTSDEVGVDYDFWIGRFPVTVAQFRCFAQDGRYANKDWWVEAIDSGFWQAGKLKVYEWSVEEGRSVEQAVTGPAKLEPLFDVPNHPVVSLNWFEATAFARWLDAWLHSQRLLPGDLVLRLASEHEWQRAAQGGRMIPQEGKWIRRRLREGLTAKGDSLNGWCENKFPRRKFPWGDEEIHDRANWSPTGINGTSVVGGFPTGRSPVGAEEIAGNAWEWTNSWYDDAKTTRVLRGGCWVSDGSDFLRCAVRDRVNPVGRRDSLGFRCVVVARAAAGR